MKASSITLSTTHLILLTICTIFSAHATVNYEQVSELQSCLINHNINNFTLYPISGHDPTTYFSLLHFSIQNLRFADPRIPKPIAIIVPESKEQLLDAFSCCNKGSFEIRVRCGGHSYEGSSYTNSDDSSPFVLIDMMRLNRVSVDLDSETAWVESGATLGQTYYSIASMSNVRGFTGGSCPTVGIGGHISGGGFGFISRKYGLAADNVVDALLIDANGRLLNREEMGEEVFWAIRGGGGGNWGIVYAWRIHLVKVPETVTGFIVSRPGPETYLTELVDKWQHVAPSLEDDVHLSATIGSGLPEAESIGLSVTFKAFFLGPKSKFVSMLNKVFPELEITEGECAEMTWIESVLYFSGLENGSDVSALTDRFLHGKNYYKAKSDYVRTPMPRKGIRAFLDIMEREPKGCVVFDPYGGAMEKISSESIAFPHRKGNMFMIQYLVQWDEENDYKSGYYMDWIRGFYSMMAPYVSSGPRAAYVNYMDFDLGIVNGSNISVEAARVWGEKYFMGNYDRLVRAKTVIDAMNVFRHQQGIPPALSTEYSGKAHM